MSKFIIMPIYRDEEPNSETHEMLQIIQSNAEQRGFARGIKLDATQGFSWMVQKLVSDAEQRGKQLAIEARRSHIISWCLFGMTLGAFVTWLVMQ